ncbi:MAG: RNA polymerase sigma factor [Acidobacteria bacterium]|nr:RNA polymerase sigma factor [Acidobacteriota bacterium]
MTAVAEAGLIERARQGDRDAFAELYAPVERPLTAFLYRMAAARLDAEDLAQETAVRALEGIEGIPEGVSFRAWIFRMGVEAALEYLRRRAQWDPDALLRAAGAPGRLHKIHKRSLQASYEIREHIDFCFTCMGRALPPHEVAALLLVEIHGFSAAEAAEALGVSAVVMQFRLQQARQALADHLESRCSLINKKGVCTDCATMDILCHGDRRHTEQALFQIELGGGLERRLAIVREIDPLHAQGRKLHEALMNFTREVNGY